MSQEHKVIHIISKEQAEEIMAGNQMRMSRLRELYMQDLDPLANYNQWVDLQRTNQFLRIAIVVGRLK